MSSQSRGPGRNPVAVSLCLMAVAFAVAILGAANAKAAFYDVVFCAGGSGSGNPVPGARPGFFDWRADCGEPPSYPAGGDNYLQLSENTVGAAGPNDEVSLSWYAPPHTSIVAGGGYTRMAHVFNQGWRARFWGEDWGGGVHNILLQGSGGIEGTGEFPWITKNTSSIFASHLWPFGGWDDYKRFVFGLACVRPGGCDRANFNAVDAHTITLVVDDRQAPQVSFEDGAMVRGEWVRGHNVLSWREFDQGSGLRFSRLGADGAVFANGTIDYGARGDCRIGYRDGGREFGKGFQPCFPGPWLRYYELATQNLSDGEHTLSICLQDYGQYKFGQDTCDRRTIRTDNVAPGKPAALQVTSANPERYLDRFGATFSLPPNQGSPITKVHYEVLDASGKVVVPKKTLPGTNPTSLASVAGPAKPGAYQLRVWLEDQVGLIGSAATAPIPHDTTPPAAPQDISVTSPQTSRASEGFDIRWRNITDAGSPIEAAHYEILNPAGGVVVSTKQIRGDSPQAIESLDTPREGGGYTLRLWLTDAEGNVGAPVKAPLAYSCVRSEAGRGLALSAALGADKATTTTVDYREGSTLSGSLRRLDGETANAPVCVFSRVITDQERQFLGVAMTGDGGEYKFALGAGPSREIMAVHRPDQREVSAKATLLSRVHPTFKLHRKVVRNKSFARFSGQIPGPHNDNVVVVLRVKSNKGWRVFRRYRTREGGRYVMRYRLTRTSTPTTYVMQAQIRTQSGYPYEQGNSDAKRLHVRP